MSDDSSPESDLESSISGCYEPQHTSSSISSPQNEDETDIDTLESPDSEANNVVRIPGHKMALPKEWTNLVMEQDGLLYWIQCPLCPVNATNSHRPIQYINGMNGFCVHMNRKHTDQAPDYYEAKEWLQREALSRPLSKIEEESYHNDGQGHFGKSSTSQSHTHLL
ncbi:hypothetical protein BU24DRAFT_117310 [Aaosphaeria arxii CBS 175.79]|uniref:Uncharacterized protein n=1 Tax=Aaosphaeria arxii CBS 175.79 TaxID=1450172 RepID=A0A6A5Y1H3_9PLEO|nr:uncharacterized protein BU24DRAFT_117310 [Aaosphaeria arxii CBS 175.79]KAF2019328.1 hypothetical protein BU24DRAFT_117310 [Aaosphaeria arxii CBS 175.79]